MIKTILAGTWACVVTLGAAYAAVSWQSSAEPAVEHEPEKLYGGLETVRTRMISVPVIRGGGIQGYVMAQFSFTADAKILKKLTVKADVVVLDEAFKAVYGEDSLDFRHRDQTGPAGPRKADCRGLQQAVRRPRSSRTCSSRSSDTSTRTVPGQPASAAPDRDANRNGATSLLRRSCRPPARAPRPGRHPRWQDHRGPGA